MIDDSSKMQEKFQNSGRGGACSSRRSTHIVHKNGQFVNRPYEQILTQFVGGDVLDAPRNERIFGNKNGRFVNRPYNKISKNIVGATIGRPLFVNEKSPAQGGAGVNYLRVLENPLFLVKRRKLYFPASPISNNQDKRFQHGNLHNHRGIFQAANT